MKPLVLLPATLLTATLLSACAGPRYWYEAPAAGDATTLTGVWQGVARNGSIDSYGWDLVGRPVEINCATYEDLIRLQVSDGRVSLELGRNNPYVLKAPIGADGHFQQQIAVKGDTWVYGGVMLLHNRPVLKVSGQLDAATGLGEGVIAVTPEQERLGCYGHFRVSRDSAQPKLENSAVPFKVQYWINEAEQHLLP